MTQQAASLIPGTWESLTSGLPTDANGNTVTSPNYQGSTVDNWVQQVQAGLSGKNGVEGAQQATQMAATATPAELAAFKAAGGIQGSAPLNPNSATFGSKAGQLANQANSLASQWSSLYGNQIQQYQNQANNVALPATGQNLSGLSVAQQGMGAQAQAAQNYQRQAAGIPQQSVAQAQNNQALSAALAQQQQAAGATNGANSLASARRQAMMAGGAQALAANNSGATARLQEQGNLDAQRLAGMQGVGTTGAQLAAASLQQSQQGEQAAEYNRNQQVAQQQYYQTLANNAIGNQYSANQYGINSTQSLGNAVNQALIGQQGLSFQIQQNQANNALNDVKLGVGAGTGLASVAALSGAGSAAQDSALQGSNAGAAAAVPDWAVAE